MPWMPSEWARRLHRQPAQSAPSGNIPTGLRIAGMALRAIFIFCLLAITIRVSMPQSETIWTVYDTPGDLVRLALGIVVCIWIVFQLFRVPKDAQSYRTWLYFGLAGIPFAVICLIAIYR